MKKIELLAPAGNMESFKAAIIAGADAIYIGGSFYSARAFAGNFSNEEIIDAINLAHLYGIRVYVTVNTLIYETEVNNFINYIDFLHQNNVDAIIIQDLGMLDLIRKTFPNLEIHSSTQMHTHTLEAVKFLESLGVKRVVLAREVNIDLISEIKKNCKVELEVFSHGALCVSYSGQCLMSSLIGGRSANRGACVGCCRLEYDLLDSNKNKISEDKYLLSMKDLCTLENIGSLIDIGVESIKIEGRMKRPEYIYQVVSIYRKAIDSYYINKKIDISREDIKDLYKIYNRKFTNGFLFNNFDVVNSKRPNHQGINIGKVVKVSGSYIYIKLDENLNRLDGIRIINKKQDYGFNVSQIYKNEKVIELGKIGDVVKIKAVDGLNVGDIVVKTTDVKQINKIDELLKKVKKVDINLKVCLRLNEKIEINVSDGKNNFKLFSDETVEKSSKISITRDNVIEKLSKLGNTIYNIKNIEVDMDDNIFVRLTVLNDLRHKFVEKLNELRMYKIEYKRANYFIDVPNFNYEKNMNYLISSENQYKLIDLNKINDLYVSDFNIEGNVIRKMPRVIEKYEDYEGRILIGEIGSLYYYKDNELVTDFSLNVTNSYTVAFLHSIGVYRVTLSYEMDYEKIRYLIECYHDRYHKHPNLEVIVYGREEMMIIKYNLLKNFDRNKIYYLKDRFKNLFLVKGYKNFIKIYNYRCRNELKLVDKYFSIGVNNIRLNIDFDEDFLRIF